jgi:hypothetical protein
LPTGFGEGTREIHSNSEVSRLREEHCIFSFGTRISLKVTNDFG